MRQALLFALLVAIAPSVTPSAQSATNDDAALLQLADRWAAARNANDVEQLRPLFDPAMDQVLLPEGDVVATDADGTLRWFGERFAREKGSVSVAIDWKRARVLPGGTGVLDYGFTARENGRAVFQTGVTFVCVKRGTEWRVVALRFASVELPTS